MSGRKKIYKFEPFEATSGVGRTAGGSQKLIYIDQQGRGQRETSTQIAYSMLVSPAFKDLTARQRMLYIYAKSQFYGARDRPCNTYPDVEEYQQHRGMMHFYLNHNLLSGVFGLYSKDNHRCLYNDIKAIVAHGFIEPCTAGGNVTSSNHTRRIYKYSTAWKDWKPGREWRHDSEAKKWRWYDLKARDWIEEPESPGTDNEKKVMVPNDTTLEQNLLPNDTTVTDVSHEKE